MTNIVNICKNTTPDGKPRNAALSKLLDRIPDCLAKNDLIKFMDRNMIFRDKSMEEWLKENAE